MTRVLLKMVLAVVFFYFSLTIGCVLNQSGFPIISGKFWDENYVPRGNWIQLPKQKVFFIRTEDGHPWLLDLEDRDIINSEKRIMFPIILLKENNENTGKSMPLDYSQVLTYEYINWDKFESCFSKSLSAANWESLKNAIILDLSRRNLSF